MKSKMKWFIAIAAITMMAIFSITASNNPVHARGAALAIQGVSALHDGQGQRHLWLSDARADRRWRAISGQRTIHA